MKPLFLFLSLVAFLAQSPAWAHSGRTDKNGCHVEKKTGLQHCHAPKKAKP